jgi:hypothetical protein
VENQPSGAATCDVAVASGGANVREESFHQLANPHDGGDSCGDGVPNASGPIYLILITPLTGRSRQGRPLTRCMRKPDSHADKRRGHAERPVAVWSTPRRDPESERSDSSSRVRSA